MFYSFGRPLKDQITEEAEKATGGSSICERKVDRRSKERALKSFQEGSQLNFHLLFVGPEMSRNFASCQFISRLFTLLSRDDSVWISLTSSHILALRLLTLKTPSTNIGREVKTLSSVCTDKNERKLSEDTFISSWGICWPTVKVTVSSEPLGQVWDFYSWSLFLTYVE